MALKLGVTGLSGRIGSELLLRRNDKLSIIALPFGRTETSSAPITETQSMLIKRYEIEAVLHLAWPASSQKDYLNDSANFQMISHTVELKNLCSSLKVDFFAVGSAIDRSLGNSSYSMSKHELRMEFNELIQKGSIGWLRPFFVFQERKWPRLVIQVQNALTKPVDNVPIKVDGAIRDYVHISDTVDAMLCAIRERLLGEIDIGSGLGRTQLDFINRLYSTRNLENIIFESEACNLPPMVADVGKLRSIGWKPTKTLQLLERN
jgi:nucleoside-diphosphate-sugar epimerase